jgi:adenylate cyclase class 2
LSSDSSRRDEETEIKVRLASREAGRASLESLGARLLTPRHLERNILFDAEERLAAAGSAVRVRWAGSRGVLTFKGPRRVVEGMKQRQEIETEVADPGAAQGVLEALGFQPSFRYEKYRETYAWKDVEIALDETPLGVFLEIEGSVEAVHEAAAALKVAPEDYIAESYIDLHFASGGEGDLIFR